MPNEEPLKKPRKRWPSQAVTTIGFHLTPKLHEAMKLLAAERGVILEVVYREAAEGFLERRKAEEIAYRATPLIHSAARVAVRLPDDLRAQVRGAAKSDRRTLANLFETAVRHYLDEHGHSEM